MSPLAPTHQTAHISALALFEDWISVRENDPVSRLTREAATPYGFIWKKWTDWLSTTSPTAQRLQRPAHYGEATALDAERFLRDGPSPASRRNGKGRASPISPVTRTRYGRVLHELHSHAIALGLATTQPFTEEVIGPQPTVRERGGQVLPPGVLEQLTRGLHQQPTPYQARDNAIIMLLVHTGMTSGEVRELTMVDVHRNRQGVNVFTLHIQGDRDMQSREVPVTGRAGASLALWLMHRGNITQDEGVVFLSDRGPQLQRAAIFRLIARHVQQACEALGMATPNHIGPGVIRNTVIVNRLRAGEPSFKVAQAMGIKEDRSLLRALGHHLS